MEQHPNSVDHQRQDTMLLPSLSTLLTPEQESAFRSDYFRRSLQSLRLGMAQATGLYALFGVLDLLIFPEARAASWFVRYAVVCPLCIAGIVATYHPSFERFQQAVQFLLVVTGGAGIIAMMVLVRSPQNYFHYAGLLLVIMYAYTFSKLRFGLATLACWLLVAFYEIAAVGVMEVPLPVLVNDNFFYIGANLFGMFSCYHRELYLRKDFLQTLLIFELEERRRLAEKENILRDLHDGIGGITTNIGMLAEMGRKATALPDAAKMLATISELANEGLAEIRTIMRSLDTSPKTWQELAAELRRLGSTMMEPHGIEFGIRSVLTATGRPPGKLVWLNLFRIYREALTNVMKHASAQKVQVDLSVDSDGLLLSVRDNGKGMGLRAQQSRGIENMKGRAREIGGELFFTSDKGTWVCVECPFPAEG
jgi:signal transduction histidine kinase